MLGTNNYPFQVLVTNGTSGAFAKDQAPSALAVGQLGYFDATTNLSLDATNIASVKEFYLAVGTDIDGTGATTSILKSAGQKIQRKNISNYTISCYQNQVAQVIQITGLTAKCDTDYTLSIQPRSIALTRSYGQNFPRITYNVRTGCCEDCASCSDATSANELANLMVNAINADTNAIATAILWDATAGAAITNLATWIAANPTLTASIRITAIFEKVSSYVYGLLNGVQDTPNGLSMNVTLNSGFECSGTVSEITPLSFARNTGGELRALEEFARGYAPEFLLYRQTESGTPLSTRPVRITGTKYFVVTLDYVDNHTGGLEQYQDIQQTIIAVPCGGSTAFLTVLDLLTASAGQVALKATADACPSC